MIESWTMRWQSPMADTRSHFSRWWRRLRNRLLCRHKVDTDQINDLDLPGMRSWILDNVDDPQRNVSVRVLIFNERYVIGGEIRFRRRADMVAFRLRWCD